MTNESTIPSGEWYSKQLLFDDILLAICVLAVISHCSIWLQLFLHKTKFDLSFIFSLGYIVGDLLVLLCYFTTYSIRIRAYAGVTRSFCIFEAYAGFLFNLLQSYDLALLNICRYHQIARNQNIYKRYRRTLICISPIVLLFIFVNLIIQHTFGWSVVVEKAGKNCNLSSNNNMVKIWNFLVIFSLPVVVSFFMLIRALYCLRNFQAQQTFIHRNHHHQLIKYSLIFYSIWLVLWAPYIVINFLDINDLNDYVAFATLLASTVEVFLDPFLVFFLDKRFARAWEKSFQWVQQKLTGRINVRVHPVTTQHGVHPVTTQHGVHPATTQPIVHPATTQPVVHPTNHPNETQL